MYRILSLCFILSLFMVGLSSCGCDREADAVDDNDDEDNITVTYENSEGETETVNVDVKDAQENLAGAMNQMAEALNGNGNEEGVEAMNFRDLKAILPDKLLGMDRTEFSGEKTGAMGFTISQAEAEYEEDDRRLEVTIVDAIGMGVAKMGLLAWANVEIDRESDDGYERTTKIDGFKALEKFDTRSGDAELIWFYKDRYVISLDGRNLEADDLRDALKRIDYDDLD